MSKGQHFCTPFKPLPWASLVAQSVKNPPAVQETWVQSLGREAPLEKEMACLEDSMDRGAWWAAAHGITESWARLSN